MSETAPFGDPLDLDVLSALREQLFELRPLKLDAPRYSTLTAAARAGDLEAIKTFLDDGADIEEQTYGSRSPLAAACSSGSEAAARLLLERGASIEPKLLRSPLIDAARGGNVAVVRRLIEAGASLNWPHGALAVVEAISAGHPAVAELLVRLQPEIQDARAWLTQPGMSEFADIIPSVGSGGGDIVDGNRFRPDQVRQYAERRRHDLSMSGKGQTRGRTARGRSGGSVLSTAERQQLLERICSRIASSEFAGMVENGLDAGPLLRIASKFGLAPVVSALIEAGCPPNARDVRGQNALHYAAKSGLGEDVLEVALTLVAAATEVDARDKDDLTPLMLAAAASDVGMVELLLDAGADATLKVGRMNAAMFVEGPCENDVVELLRRRAPERPAVSFAEPGNAVPAEMGCRRWLDDLPGDGRVWAILGELEEVAAAGAVVLGAKRIDDFDRQPAPRISGGWILLQLKESDWILLWPFGSESQWGEGVQPRIETLSGALGPELLTVRARDTAGSVTVRRLRGGKVVESVGWEIGGRFRAFRSELRSQPEWLCARKSRDRKRAAHRIGTFDRYFAELALEVPNHRLDDDGLDTQLVLFETARHRVVGVVGLANWA